jgi:superfamily II DNA or RNA helicase
MIPEVKRLNAQPIAVGAAAIYPWKQGWIDVGERTAKYPDEDGNRKFNLFTEIGTDVHRRILVPRNMAPSITKDLRVVGTDVHFDCTFKPRNEEQSRVIKESVAHLQKGVSHIVEAPTGFGKTWCASKIIAEVGKKTIITVTKEDILDQWVAAFEALFGLKTGIGKGIGLIRGNTCDTVNQKVVIAMVQSLAKEQRYPEWNFKDFGFAVWDEVHRIGADFFSQSCFRVPAYLRLGISATPDRSDGREEVIAAHIGPVLVKSKAAPMTPRIIAQESPWEIPRKRRLDKEGKLIVDKETKVPILFPIEHSGGRCGHIFKMMAHHHGRNKVIVNFVKSCFDKGRTKGLIQSETRDHLEVLASLISSAGVPVAHISFYVGGLTKGQRAKAKEGKIIMATYAQTKEATDIPEVDFLVMCMPKADPRQIVGRATRWLPGKQQPVIFDLRDSSSSVFRGFAEARDEWYKSIGAVVQHVSIKAPHIDKQAKSVTIASSKNGA